MTADLRGEVAAGRQALRESYLRRPNPRALLTQHSQLIDRTVRKVWNEIATVRDAALVATGGYGRGELYPSSDIDLLVLLAKDPSEAEPHAYVDNFHEVTKHVHRRTLAHHSRLPVVVLRLQDQPVFVHQAAAATRKSPLAEEI